MMHFRRFSFQCFSAVAFLLCMLQYAARGQAGGQTNPAFEELARRAEQARIAGQRDAAIQAYEQALLIRPEWQEGLWYLGTLDYEADRYAEAIPVLQKVSLVHPEAGPVWAFLGLCEFRTGTYARSLEHLQRARALGLSEDPEVAQVASYHLALLFNLNGKFQEAMNLLSADFPDKLSVEQINTALGMALLRIPLLPEQVDPSHDALIQTAGKAAAFVAYKDFGNADARFAQMFRDYPNLPYLHYAYGVLLSSLGRKDEANKQLKEEAAHQGHAPAGPETWQSPNNNIELAIACAYGKSSALSRCYPVGPETKAASAATKQTDFEAFKERAAAALKSGKSEEAIAMLQDGLSLYPDWSEGWRSLGELQYQQAHYSQAITALKSAVNINESDSGSRTLLGLAEFEAKEYNNAFIHLKRGKELGFGLPDNIAKQASYKLALLWDRNGDFDRATDLLLSSFGRDHLSEEVRTALGISLLRLRSLPDELEPAQVLLVHSAGEATQLLAQSRYDQAFGIFQQLVREYPQTSNLHYAYASALASISKYEDAEVQLQQALLLNPQNAAAYALLSSILLKMNRLEAARDAAKESVQLDADSFEGHYWLGRSWLELGNPQDAVKELEIASRIEPYSPEVHYNLSRAYARANSPEQAQRERANFARLNAMLQQQEGMPGSQAYGEARDRGQPMHQVTAPAATSPP
jgi:predicted Zn-dependent protease